MGDFQTWFYIILGVVIVVSRLIKKGAEVQKERDQQQQRTPTRPTPAQPTNIPATSQDKPRQLTFEELLQEISQKRQAQTYPVEPPKQTYVDYDDDLEEEEQGLEEIEPEYKKIQRSNAIYEDAKREAFNRKSLEETMKVEHTVMEFSKFKVFEEEERRNLLEEYTRDLRDPEGFKKAFVLTEILNRRF